MKANEIEKHINQVNGRNREEKQSGERREGNSAEIKNLTKSQMGYAALSKPEVTGKRASDRKHPVSGINPICNAL